MNFFIGSSFGMPDMETVAMGAWSPALFADDDAADLRADYRTCLADAQSDAGATDLAARDYDASS
jgi:hypothetical protein